MLYEKFSEVIKGILAVGLDMSLKFRIEDREYDNNCFRLKSTNLDNLDFEIITIIFKYTGTPRLELLEAADFGKLSSEFI